MTLDDTPIEAIRKRAATAVGLTHARESGGAVSVDALPDSTWSLVYIVGEEVIEYSRHAAKDITGDLSITFVVIHKFRQGAEPHAQVRAKLYAIAEALDVKPSLWTPPAPSVVRATGMTVRAGEDMTSALLSDKGAAFAAGELAVRFEVNRT